MSKSELALGKKQQQKRLSKTFALTPHCSNHVTCNLIWIQSNSLCVWMPVMCLFSSSAYYGFCMLMSAQVHKPPSTAALSSSQRGAGLHGTASQAATILSWSIKINHDIAQRKSFIEEDVVGRDCKAIWFTAGGLTNALVVRGQTEDNALVRLTKSWPHWLALN